MFPIMHLSSVAGPPVSRLSSDRLWGPSMPCAQPLSQYLTEHKKARGNGGRTEPDDPLTRGARRTDTVTGGPSRGMQRQAVRLLQR